MRDGLPLRLTLAERLRGLPRLWFGFGRPVRRLEYAVSGVFLAGVKYGLDSAIYWSVAGKPWPVTSYVAPAFEERFPNPVAATDWAVWVLALLMIPFLWIGASMTFRRCADAGVSAAVGLLFFVPVVNYPVMLALCFLGSRPHGDVVDPWTGDPLADSRIPLRDLFLAVGSGIGIGLGMVVVSVLLFKQYGLAMFVGAPFVSGVIVAYIVNRRERRRAATTFGVIQLSLLVTALCLLIFAIEGLICVLMAWPIAAVLATLGGFVGLAVARSKTRSAATAIALVVWLPLLLAADVGVRSSPLSMVLTSVEIDAPPEQVWPNVVRFTELPRPRRAIFLAGVAYPVRARIEGQGPGAVRYCEFSTGPFVEPITAWEEPTRLAFDVASQPEPMRELSPYSRVYAPHLGGGLVSERGEFRLVRLPGGRTRLEGRTWYRLDIRPGVYWRLWSDAIIHTIHRRVLDHVRRLSEGSRSDAP